MRTLADTTYAPLSTATVSTPARGADHGLDVVGPCPLRGRAHGLIVPLSWPKHGPGPCRQGQQSSLARGHGFHDIHGATLENPELQSCKECLTSIYRYASRLSTLTNQPLKMKMKSVPCFTLLSVLTVALLVFSWVRIGEAQKCDHTADPSCCSKESCVRACANQQFEFCLVDGPKKTWGGRRVARRFVRTLADVGGGDWARWVRPAKSDMASVGRARWEQENMETPNEEDSWLQGTFLMKVEVFEAAVLAKMEAFEGTVDRRSLRKWRSSSGGCCSASEEGCCSASTTKDWRKTNFPFEVCLILSIFSLSSAAKRLRTERGRRTCENAAKSTKAMEIRVKDWVFHLPPLQGGLLSKSGGLRSGRPRGNGGLRGCGRAKMKESDSKRKQRRLSYSWEDEEHTLLLRKEKLEAVVVGDREERGGVSGEV
ncbi:hypothetical protein NL676_033045 [Syzygium grande]|nr:hypothetical protein NL676_033045 [Syzygium grande]